MRAGKRKEEEDRIPRAICISAFFSPAHFLSLLEPVGKTVSTTLALENLMIKERLMLKVEWQFSTT